MSDAEVSKAIEQKEFQGHVPFFIGDQSYSNSRLEWFADTQDFNRRFGPDGDLYGCLCPQVVSVSGGGAVLAVVAQKLDADQLAVMNERSKLIDEEVTKRTNARKEREAAKDAARKAEEFELKRLAELGRKFKEKVEASEAKEDKQERQALKKAIALASDPELRRIAETMISVLDLKPDQYNALLTRVGQVTATVIGEFCEQLAKEEGAAK